MSDNPLVRFAKLGAIFVDLGTDVMAMSTVFKHSSPWLGLLMAGTAALQPLGALLYLVMACMEDEPESLYGVIKAMSYLEDPLQLAYIILFLIDSGFSYVRWPYISAVASIVFLLLSLYSFEEGTWSTCGSIVSVVGIAAVLFIGLKDADINEPWRVGCTQFLADSKCFLFFLCYMI